jgi:hypothetical protein
MSFGIDTIPRVISVSSHLGTLRVGTEDEIHAQTVRDRVLRVESSFETAGWRRLKGTTERCRSTSICNPSGEEHGWS